MTAENKSSIHGLSDGRSVFWALRSLLVPRRDIDLAPEDGVFEAQPVEAEAAKVEPPTVRSQRTVGDHAHHTYLVGGQMTPIYQQHSGRRFAARV